MQEYDLGGKTGGGGGDIRWNTGRGFGFSPL